MKTAARISAGLALSLSFFNSVHAQSEARVIQHVDVYKVPGRFGGWPANHGIWSWGNEILVGLSEGAYKERGLSHHFDPDQPEYHLLARSLDGGETWTIENPQEKGFLIPYGTSLHGVAPPELAQVEPRDCPGGIDFTHPDLAFTVRMTDTHRGPSRFHYSYDRGRTWEGPFKLPDLGTPGVAARTDYLVNGKHDCTIFVTVAKSNNREGRALAARTVDGGRTWQRLGFIGPEPDPDGFSIMPSTVRLSARNLLAALRQRKGGERWIDVYHSNDNGLYWQFLSRPVKDTGVGNPPALLQLRDGRLALAYGFRAEPFGIRATISRDGGKTWGEAIILRDDGGGRDLGYPRMVQREDGHLVTVYYFNDQPDGDRYVAATIWDPGQ